MFETLDEIVDKLFNNDYMKEKSEVDINFEWKEPKNGSSYVTSSDDEPLQSVSEH